MSSRVFALALLVLCGCRTLSPAPRGQNGQAPEQSTPQTTAPTASDETQNQTGTKPSEESEGVPGYLLTLSDVTINILPPQTGATSIGIDVKINPNAFGNIKPGDPIGLMFYRLNDLSAAALERSNGQKRIKATNLGYMELTYQPDRGYTFPMFDTSGEFGAPIVMKMVPIPVPPEAENSIALAKPGAKIRGVYRFPNPNDPMKIFDEQNLRQDAPEILIGE